MLLKPPAERRRRAASSRHMAQLGNPPSPMHCPRCPSSPLVIGRASHTCLKTTPSCCCTRCEQHCQQLGGTGFAWQGSGCRAGGPAGLDLRAASRRRVTGSGWPRARQPSSSNTRPPLLAAAAAAAAHPCPPPPPLSSLPTSTVAVMPAPDPPSQAVEHGSTYKPSVREVKIRKDRSGGVAAREHAAGANVQQAWWQRVSWHTCLWLCRAALTLLSLALEKSTLSCLHLGRQAGRHQSGGGISLASTLQAPISQQLIFALSLQGTTCTLCVTWTSRSRRQTR